MPAVPVEAEISKTAGFRVKGGRDASSEIERSTTVCPSRPESNLREMFPLNDKMGQMGTSSAPGAPLRITIARLLRPSGHVAKAGSNSRSNF